MKLAAILESIPNFIFVDPEEQEAMDGAWAIAEESNINILSDMELMGVVVPNSERIQEEGPGAQDVVGAWFGGNRGSDVFSFDVVVDPAYQGNGIGKMLFDAAMQEGQNFEEIHLTIVNSRLINLAVRNGFEAEGGTWVKKNY